MVLFCSNIFAFWRNSRRCRDKRRGKDREGEGMAGGGTEARGGGGGGAGEGRGGEVMVREEGSHSYLRQRQEGESYANFPCKKTRFYYFRAKGR